MTIVRTPYRYKRPPRKRKPNLAALAMPRIVTAKKPKPGPPPKTSGDTRIKAQQPEPPPANDDRKSAIVTVRSRKHAAQAPDMTPEEHKRRGDAADALFRNMKRAIAEKLT